MRKSLLISLSILLLLPLLINFNLFARCGQQERRPEILQHEVTVTLKLIQVYVTDKKGNPVIDLWKENFSIYDSGKRKTITEFEKHILSLPSAMTRVQPEIIEETKIPFSREPLNRKFFLFFDFAYNNPKGILKAKKAALHFLDTKLLPPDEVGVLSYSAIKGLKLHEFLTIDRAKAREIIEALGLKEIAGRAEDLEEQFWFWATNEEPLDASKDVKVFEKYKPPAIKTSFEASKFFYLEDTGLHALHFIQKMAAFAKALRYVPGIKYIILFSSGLPYSSIYGIKSPFGKIAYDGSWGNPLLRLRHEDLLKELSSSNTIIYAFDTEDTSTRIKGDLRMTGAFTLQKTASSTGGKYFGNINEYEKHMESIQNLTACYYVLGYYIDEKWDGKYHNIKVEVDRPGVKVYAQKGYFNPKPFKDYSDLERMLHLVDLALSENPLFQTPLRFPLKALPSPAQGKQNLALWARVEKEKIQEIAAQKVEVVTILFGEKENIVKMERKEADLSRLPEGPLYLSSFLPLAPGEYKCRLVIRNLESGRGAVASSSVSVPELQAEGLRLYPPLLLKEEEGGFYLQVSRTPVDFPFDRTKYTPLIGELERGTDNLYAVVRCAHPGIQKREIKLLGNLLKYQPDTTTVVPVSISILESKREGDTEVFLLQVQTEGLEAGEYLLYLFAEELKTASNSQVNTSFKVK